MEQMGVISGGKKDTKLMPLDKILASFMWRHNLIFMHLRHLQPRCVALICFSVFLMGKFG